MKKERRGAIRRRLGPVGLSLAAAAVTAIGFAAVSLAQNNDGSSGNGANQSLPPPPRGGVVFTQPANLSAQDRQKMQEFQQCMQDNGAPAPPRFDPSQGPPKPPSTEDQQKVKQAYEACKDKLPQDLQNAGPPGIGVGHCGPPPPGAPVPQRGQNQDQGGQSPGQGGQSSGSTQ